MPLHDEIELRRDFESVDEELLLALYHSHQLLERSSAAFLSRYELTATQFNALMIIRDYQTEGIKQRDLARLLLVNRASAGALVDVLSRRELVGRRAVDGDRRAYHLELTRKGRRLLERLLPPYYAEMEGLFSIFGPTEKQRALAFLERFRASLRHREGGASS